MILIPLTDETGSSSVISSPNRSALRCPLPAALRRDATSIFDAILRIEQADEIGIGSHRPLPPTQTCYLKYCAWRRAGFVQWAMAILNGSPPSVTGIDGCPRRFSAGVKTGPPIRSLCRGKADRSERPGHANESHDLKNHSGRRPHGFGYVRKPIWLMDEHEFADFTVLSTQRRERIGGCQHHLHMWIG